MVWATAVQLCTVHCGVAHLVVGLDEHRTPTGRHVRCYDLTRLSAPRLPALTLQPPGTHPSPNCVARGESRIKGKLSRGDALWQSQCGRLLHPQLVPIAVGLGQWGEEHRCLHNTPHAMRARLTHMRRIAMDPGQRCGPWVTCVSLPSILTMMYT
jgi:hypothetical protein